MNKTLELPIPSLSRGLFASIAAYTDEPLFRQTGVRIAFTEKQGGVSGGAYRSLNLGSMVGDRIDLVQKNRRHLFEAFGAEHLSCIVPKQVHGDTVLSIPEEAEGLFEDFQQLADLGADALVVEAKNLATLLCFADCIPVICVSPSGRFAVIHAGWRGVENSIATKAISLMMLSDKEAGFPLNSSHYNVYIGPHIRSCCFETGSEVHQAFVQKFGSSCASDAHHIDLSSALCLSLEQAGVQHERIADVELCTVCENDHFFSYRAQNGVCGRHGAFAFRI